MATKTYTKSSLTGGIAGSLDSIDGADLSNGDKAIVISETDTRAYILDADSGLAEDGDDVISPDTNAGDKRWIKSEFDIDEESDYVGKFVSNSNGNPNVSDTLFDVVSNVLEATWRTVGPTGTLSQNEWTALDDEDLVSNPDYYRLRVYVNCSSPPALSNAAVAVYARSFNSTQDPGIDNCICAASAYDPGIGQAVSEVTVPVDSAGRFYIYWSSGFTTNDINLVLVGAGQNSA